MEAELRRRIRDKALGFLLGFVSYRLHADNMPRLAHPFADQGFCLGRTCFFGNVFEQLGGDEHALRVVKRRHQYDAGRFGLIAKPFARYRKYERENEAHSHVVPPRSPWEIPKNEPLQKTARFFVVASACAHELILVLPHYGEYPALNLQA
jgi:hypothetical protein